MWAVLVPEALAYASIAGVSPVVGLYAAPAALVLYALLGSSRCLIVGPMSATAALSAAAVANLAGNGPDEFAAFTAALALMVGVLALVAGLCRLGFLASFISEPVLKGFIIGLALTIIVGQLPKLFGVEKGDGNFFRQLWALLGNLGDTQWRTPLVGLVSLAIVLGLRQITPVVPGALVAVLAGVALVKLSDLDQHGVAIVGPIASGLPSFGLPDGISFYDFLATAGPAVGITLVGFAEGLGAAKAYATHDHEPIDSNRELLGLGAANLGSGLSSGMVVNGSLSKTAVNGGACAHSQVSGLVVAVMTIVTLLLLTGLFEKLPEATLAAVVIAAVIELVDVPALRRLYGIYTQRLGRAYGVAARPDSIAAVAAMLGVMVFDTLPGLFIGIACSIVLLIYRASRPRVAALGKVPGAAGHYSDIDRHPEDVSPAGVAVLRVEAGLYFANSEWVRGRIREAAGRDGIHAVVLDAESVPFIDVSAVEMLEQLDRDLERDGVGLFLARDIGQVRDVMRHATDDPALARFYPTVQAAVDAAQKASRPDRASSVRDDSP